MTTNLWNYPPDSVGQDIELHLKVGVKLGAKLTADCDGYLLVMAPDAKSGEMKQLHIPKDTIAFTVFVKSVGGGIVRAGADVMGALREFNGKRQ